MSEAQELVRVLLRERVRTDAEADAVLSSAARLGVDPLDYCIHRFSLGDEEVIERGAHWAGLAFSPVVPCTGNNHVDMTRLDELAGRRSMREILFDREITFIAPKFSELVSLKGYAAAHPDFRRHTCVAPPRAIRAALARISSGQLLDESRQRLARRWPYASAHLDLGRLARWLFVLATASVAAATIAAPVGVQWLLLPPVALVLLLPALFRFIALLGAQEVEAVSVPPLSDADLPVYSVLVPLHDEAQMVPLLERALGAIDYPPEKLDIKFVVEARSVATVAAVRSILADPRFELVEVPEAPPFTKPKALDYALPFARGEHVAIFDAEDIPSPDQLRLAAAHFAASPDVDCLQAELLVDNARENLLTGLFTGEYAGQFGVVLPALAFWGLPMPLGGTSNHFRTAVLRAAGGWDAFNVTEDADLGVRLARLRHRVAMLPSQTWEEAPVSLDVWMRQRTRWMKGWMQTFIVHNHHLPSLARDMGWRGWLAFEVYVGSMILSPLLHTAFLIGLVVALLGGAPVLFDLTDPRTGVAIAVLVAGYGASFALVIAGLVRLGQRRLLLLQLLLPLYWVLHSVAAARACYELLTRPHFWAKTAHGRTRLKRSFDAASYRPAAERVEWSGADIETIGRASAPPRAAQ